MRHIHPHTPSRALSLVPLLLLALLAAPARADDEAKKKDPAELALRTQRVVVFKDGYALFARSGAARADERGRVFTYEVPDAAVLGAFWAVADGDRPVGMLAEIVTTEEQRTEEAACVSMLDLLRANAGRRVTLGLGEEELPGVLAQVLDREVPSEPPGGASRRPQPPLLPSESEREILPQGGALVVMKETPKGQVVVPVGQVQRLAGPDLVTTTTRTFEKRSVTKRLSLDLGKASAGKEVQVRLFHFAPGLRWIPTYRVSGDLESSAQLALQAEILNEALDLEGAALDLVVGVPNFKFKEVISPLALEAQLRNALQQAAPQLMGQQAVLSNAFFQNRAGERRGAQPPGPGGLDIAPDLATEASQDLFVYSVPGMTLAKGARATIPLWHSQVPLRHVYTVDVALGRDAQGGQSFVRSRERPRERSPLSLAEHRVWHQLELQNVSEVPWTTGAALTLQGTLPIGQELLTYTPRKGRTFLPLTVAVDVRVDFSEQEAERTPNAARYDGHSYARVRKQATIRVSNHRSEPTTLRARLALGGKVLEASDDGKVRLDVFRAADWDRHGNYGAYLNHHSDTEWNVTIEPGKVKVLTCLYEFFVR